MHRKRVIIIGAGFGGLSAAALLGKAGFDVTVLEKNEQVGGRASVFQANGFTFDMGPSWYLMPDVFERFFAHFGTKPNEFYSLQRLDPHYQIYFNQQNRVDIRDDIATNMRLFDQLEPGAGAQLQRYLDDSSYKYDVAMQKFIYKDYRTILDVLDWQLIYQGLKLHLFERFDTFINRFFTNERLKKILGHSLVFLGCEPSNTPALYSILAHVDLNLGVWYPQGGFGRVSHALHQLAINNGANIMCNQDVKHITVDDGLAKTVLTTSGSFEADIVLVNADYHHAETELLPAHAQTYPKSYWKKRTVAPSAFIMYLGFSEQIPGLQHHNLMLEDNWDLHFDSLFRDNKWPDFPNYYVCCPSKTDPSVAPKGMENVFILVPIAAGLTDTDEIRQQFRDKILRHLEITLNVSLQNKIVYERIFAVNDFSTRYNAYRGTGLGLSHSLWQTALFRPHNHSKKVDNLYYTGQYTHPGIGLPMTLVASEIVCKKIMQHYG